MHTESPGGSDSHAAIVESRSLLSEKACRALQRDLRRALQRDLSEEASTADVNDTFLSWVSEAALGAGGDGSAVTVLLTDGIEECYTGRLLLAKAQPQPTVPTRTTGSKTKRVRGGLPADVEHADGSRSTLSQAQTQLCCALQDTFDRCTTQASTPATINSLFFAVLTKLILPGQHLFDYPAVHIMLGAAVQELYTSRLVTAQQGLGDCAAGPRNLNKRKAVGEFEDDGGFSDDFARISMD